MKKVFCDIIVDKKHNKGLMFVPPNNETYTLKNLFKWVKRNCGGATAIKYIKNRVVAIYENRYEVFSLEDVS